MKEIETVLDPCTGGVTTPASPGANLHLMRGRLLARNVIWNLLETVAPMLVAVRL